MKDLKLPVTLTCQGIIRTLDSIGRVVIPAEWRGYYNIGDRDNVEMIMTDKGILVCRNEPKEQKQVKE